MKRIVRHSAKSSPVRSTSYALTIILTIVDNPHTNSNPYNNNERDAEVHKTVENMTL
jgi:hypothetical protein